MFYVLVTKGKGDSQADTVRFECFVTEKMAEDYCKIEHQPFSADFKYWTNCKVVKSGEIITTFAK